MNFMVIFLALFVWAVPQLTFASHHTGDAPATVGSGIIAPTPTPAADTEKQVDLRFFYKQKKFNHMFEYKHRIEMKMPVEAKQRTFRSFRIGTYYRLHKFIKLGVFLIRQYGARHDEDWVTDPDGWWIWQDTNSREEDEVMGDFTFRRGAGLKNLIFEVKTRFVNNFFNNHQTLKIRPGLTYFWIRKGKPLFNFFLQYEQYRPLNFSEEKVYETWLYAGLTYHAFKNVKPGLFFAKRTINWTSFPHFVAAEGTTYKYTVKSNVIGLTMVFPFR